MTQETETAPVELNIVSCQTCDALFIESERRQTCPSCGGPPVGPYFQFVLDDSGLHRKDGPVEVKPPVSIVDEQRKVAGMPPATAPAAEEEPVEEEGRDWRGVFAEGVATYLQGGGIAEDDLRTVLEGQLGAEPEAAAIAVGRLVAVRELLEELAEAGDEEKVVVEAEGAGEPVEPPPSEPESGPESV